MSWENIKLGDTLTLQRGYDLPIQDRREGNIPIVGSAGITGYHNKAKVEGGGVTLGRSGNSFGQVFYCKEDFWPHNAALYVKDYKGNSKKFIYYFLKNMDFSNYNSGSAQPSLNRNFIYPIPVKFPKLEIQKKIASVLSSYDDLIENNLKRIKLLEEAAQYLYKEWFVDFRFPGSENTPINKETGLPQGWKNGYVSDVCRVFSGFAFKSEQWKDLGNPVIKIKNINNNTVELKDTGFIDDVAAIKAEKFQLFEGDIVIAMTGATVGKIGLIPKNEQKIFLNQRVGLFRPISDDKNNIPYIFSFFLSDNAQQQVINLARGAAQPNISTKEIGKIKIILPEKTILEMFNKKVIFFLQQIQILYCYNNSLKEARDLLLPRLMNKSIEV